MKRIIPFLLAFVLVSVTASAQPGLRQYRSRPMPPRGELTKPEQWRLNSDLIRYRIAARRARRDGFVGPVERMRLHRMKCRTRRDEFIFRHNRRRPVI